MINNHNPQLSHDQIIARIQCYFDILLSASPIDFNLDDHIEIYYTMFEDFIYDVPIQPDDYNEHGDQDYASPN